MGLFMNKLAKHYLTGCFEEWYAQNIVKQVEDNNDEEEQGERDVSAACQHVLSVMKELIAKRLVGCWTLFVDILTSL